MADNILINAPSVPGGQTVATDDIGGIQHELVKIEYGGDGSATMVDAANPLPVTDAVAEAALTSIAAEDFATQTTLAALLAKVIAAPSTEAKQDAMITLLTTIAAITQPLTDAQLRATPVPVSGTITTGGLTDVQLRATPVPISGTVAITGGGDASAANQTTQITAEQAIQAAVQIMDDWDESDRAKVNLIVGQAGVQGDTGVITANTQRVVIATNQSAIPVTFSGSPAVDNTTLYSGTLSVTGAITGIDTTGYESVAMQLSGVWTGNLIIEGSLDNSIWQSLFVTSVNEPSMQELIIGNGIFHISVTAKYIRINVNQIAGSVTALILGRVGAGISAADRLSLAMDKYNGSPLYVEETGTNKDVYKSLIPSDAPKPIYGTNTVANGVLCIIDTTGYQSIAVQTISNAATYTFQHSQDGVVWANLLGAQPDGTVTPASGTSSATIMVFPVIARFFRVTNASAGGKIIAYLRQTPVSVGIINQNLAWINGSAVGSANLAGVLPVAGGNSTGSNISSGANPVLMGGIDPSNLLKKVLVDTNGRVYTYNSGIDPSGTNRPMGMLSPSSNPYNVASSAVQDVSTYEGMSQTEINGEMLKYLKLIAYYLSETPALLNFNNNRFDEPQVLVNDPTFLSN